NAPVPPGLIRGVVALYPGCRRMGQALPAWNPAVPVLLLLGALDDWTPARWFEALAAAVPRGAARVEVHTYPGAHHGFDMPGVPLRELVGLAGPRNTAVHIGTEPVAREDALVRIPAFLAQQGGVASR
ncbi:MAG: dienelactone hydrolase family protein, partial [Acetobacteraceae bacterium]|nr:dienelactone hydrolase family protein [Acetobacteraceae bacterium]